MAVPPHKMKSEVNLGRTDSATLFWFMFKISSCMTFKIDLIQIPGLGSVVIPLAIDLPEENFPNLVRAQLVQGFQKIGPVPTGENALDHAVHGQAGNVRHIPPEPGTWSN